MNSRLCVDKNRLLSRFSIGQGWSADQPQSCDHADCPEFVLLLNFCHLTGGFISLCPMRCVASGAEVSVIGPRIGATCWRCV